MPAPTKMSLYVTGVCNLACSECIMQHAMAADPKYQMAPAELQALVEFGEKSKYRFDFVLTGGEPLIWKHLLEGLAILRGSSITNKITMFSNAMFYDRVTPVIAGMLDDIRISHYFYNTKQMEQLKAMYPDKVHVVERTGFWKNPSEPLPPHQSLPVECMNPEVMLYDYEVYACPHNLSIAKGCGSEVQLSVPVKQVNFLKELRNIKHSDAHAREICTRCISNGKVRRHAEKTLNVSRGKEDISQFGINPHFHAAEHGLTVPTELVQLDG